MKAIILAAVATMLTGILVTLILREFRLIKRIRALLLVYFAILAGLAAVSLGTSSDLSFLPSGLLAEPWWLDFLATLFFFSAAFFGGILQLYNLADRGLSLRILIEIVERGNQGATLTELSEGYSGGRGIAWMYDKRVKDIISCKLAVIDGNVMTLTDRGKNLAYIYEWLRSLIGLRLNRGP
jgi:hypothetical protein